MSTLNLTTISNAADVCARWQHFWHGEVLGRPPVVASLTKPGCEPVCPGALPHLDDVLAITEIDAIQWVPGDGQPPMHTWTDVLLRCQRAGKAVQIYGVTPEEVKQLHRILTPNKTACCVDVTSADECNELLAWLEHNT